MASQSTSDKRALAKFLFHLGKGLWKSVPLLGPLVDEVVYAQYESKLLQEIEGLSEGDIKRIADALPKLDEEELAERFREISMETQILSLEQFSRVLDDVHTSRTEILNGLAEVTDKLSGLPSMQASRIDASTYIDHLKAA